MRLVATGRRLRLQPPSYLSADERSLFKQIVGATAADHFVASDLPLLVSFVQCTLIVRRAAVSVQRDASYLAAFEKAVRAQCALGSRLRLSPSSRFDARAAGRRASGGGFGFMGGQPSYYETMDDDDER